MNVAQVYDSKVLNPDVHRRLVQDIDRIAREAGIPPYLIWTPLSQSCVSAEIDYVKNFRRHQYQGKYGLVYEGLHLNDSIVNKMMAMAGAFLRNFVNAKVMTIQEVLHALRYDNMPEATVLLIPNFYVSDMSAITEVKNGKTVGKTKGGSGLADWQISNLLGLLISRMGACQQTVVYCQSLAGVELEYGVAIKQHLMKNFYKMI